MAVHVYNLRMQAGKLERTKIRVENRRDYLVSQVDAADREIGRIDAELQRLEREIEQAEAHGAEDI